ncbi:hypothetical protein DRQ25_10515 [Candidatus Fermentibacteria bacterium]|nr:MAG: hypothetical protein DRQ25_10515 [Candidatus Fermentibacteria bacterium]
MKRAFSGSFFRGLIILSSVFLLLTLVLLLFANSIRNMEDRKNALLLANQIFSTLNGSFYPEVGVFDSTAVSGGVQYGIRRTVSEVSSGIREMHIYVGRNDGSNRIVLVRKYYDL